MANELTKVTDQNGVDHPFKDLAAFPRSEQAVLGAKNLIPYPYNNTTKTEGGVTFTLNADGTVGIDTDGSASSSNAYFSIVGQSAEKLETGSYVLSGGVNNNVVIQYYDVTAGKSYNSTNEEIIVPVVKGHIRQISIVVLSGTTVNNEVVKPMISFDGGDYAEPAMTNKELTERVFNKEIILTSGDDLNNVIETGIYRIYETPTNAPESISYATLLVHKVGSTVTEQVIFRAGTIYSRVSGSNPRQWYAWYKFTGTTV